MSLLSLLQVLPKVAAKSCRRKKLPQKVATSRVPPGAQLLRTRSAPQQHPVQLQYQTSDRRALAMGVSNLALRNGHSQHRIDQLAEPLLTIMVPPVIESQLASDRRQPWAKRLQSLYMPEFLPRCNLHSVRDRCGALSRGPYDWSDPGHYSVKLQVLPKVAAKSCRRKKLPPKVATSRVSPGARLLRARSAPQQHPVQLQYQTPNRRALAMGLEPCSPRWAQPTQSRPTG